MALLVQVDTREVKTPHFFLFNLNFLSNLLRCQGELMTLVCVCDRNVAFFCFRTEETWKKGNDGNGHRYRDDGSTVHGKIGVFGWSRAVALQNFTVVLSCRMTIFFCPNAIEFFSALSFNEEANFIFVFFHDGMISLDHACYNRTP